MFLVVKRDISLRRREGLKTTFRLHTGEVCINPEGLELHPPTPVLAAERPLMLVGSR